MYNIASVVVTYNRKELLLRSLSAVHSQTLPPDIIYIIDNHSTDGTAELLRENNYIKEIPALNAENDIVISSDVKSLSHEDKSILIKYIYKAVNDGAAGGFYAGMKAAFDDGYEWFFLMDDDGVPKENNIELLYNNAVKYDIPFINAYNVWIKRDNFELVPMPKSELKDEIIYDFASPWNGTLIKRDVPEKIGFVKKEMFIWGEEVEYKYRTNAAGFKIATVASAIYYHPYQKSKRRGIIPFIEFPPLGVPVMQDVKRSSIVMRNRGYNDWTYRGKIFTIIKILSYALYFALRFKFKLGKQCISSYIKGCKNIF